MTTTCFNTVPTELDRLIVAMLETPEPRNDGYVCTGNSDIVCERAAPRAVERAPLPIYPLPADLPPAPVVRRFGNEMKSNIAAGVALCGFLGGIASLLAMPL